MAGDLARYGVLKIGDQLLLQDAIQALRAELETPRMTLQSLASTLAGNLSMTILAIIKL
jgi:hypothetical protein